MATPTTNMAAAAAAPMALPSDAERLRNRELLKTLACLLLILLAISACFLAVPLIADSEFLVSVDAVGGGGAATAALNVTVSVRNYSLFRAFCSRGGELRALYAGRQLGRWPVPEFCLPRRRRGGKAAETAWASAMRRAEDLGARLAGEWLRGEAQVSVRARARSGRGAATRVVCNLVLGPKLTMPPCPCVKL